jgi:hypothetical protein
MKFCILFFLLISLVGCATQNKREARIQERLSHEEVTDGASLSKSIHHLIAESKALSDSQKKDLTKLVDNTGAKNRALLEKSYKMRSLLVKELLSEKIDTKMVKQLKKDIRKTELERIKNSLETMDKMSSEISHLHNKDAFTEQLLYIERAYR